MGHFYVLDKSPPPVLPLVSSSRIWVRLFFGVVSFSLSSPIPRLRNSDPVGRL